MKVRHLLIASTLSALVGAGIAVGVMTLWEPWDDSSGSVSQADIDRLSEEIADLSTAVEDSGMSQAEADALKCVAAIEAPTQGRFQAVPAHVQDIIDEFC